VSAKNVLYVLLWAEMSVIFYKQCEISKINLWSEVFWNRHPPNHALPITWFWFMGVTVSYSPLKHFHWYFSNIFCLRTKFLLTASKMDIPF